jgi:hypothetical protein
VAPISFLLLLLVVVALGATLSLLRRWPDISASRVAVGVVIMISRRLALLLIAWRCRLAVVALMRW